MKIDSKSQEIIYKSIKKFSYRLKHKTQSRRPGIYLLGLFFALIEKVGHYKKQTT